MYKGYADSVALEISMDILAKLTDIAVINTAKNKIVLNQELLPSFKLGKKVMLYDYLGALESDRVQCGSVLPRITKIDDRLDTFFF
jgi:hypothetical protein